MQDSWPWWALAVLAVGIVILSLLCPAPGWARDLAGRLAFWRREPVRDRLRARRGLAYLYAVLITVAVAVVVVWPLPSLLTRHPHVEAAARHTAITNTRTGLIAALAALGAGIGLAYTARTYRLSREGHITDRYSKSIEQLGSDKIEVRLGGTYALERLMRDSPADRPTIVEALAAYIREHAPRTAPAPTLGAGCAESALPEQPAEDVQAALTVLGRRTPAAREDPIDLRNTYLAQACLDRATLIAAQLDMTTLTDAQLGGANLADALLGGADLAGAQLLLANLSGALLTEADLTGAELTDADLTSAQLAGAKLAGALLTRADLTDARVTKGALSPSQLDRAEGVSSIIWLEPECDSDGAAAEPPAGAPDPAT